MNNVLYAILPFLLFGFISEILLKGRFSRRLNLIIYNAVFFVAAVVHLAVGLAALDNAFLLSLMPVSAYLPVAVTAFALSRRNVADTLFALFIAILAAIIVRLSEELYVGSLLRIVTGIAGDVLCLFISLAVSSLLGFVAFRYLRRIFAREKVLDTKNWYIDLALFFLAGLSVYLENMTNSVAAAVLVLLCDASVFAVIVAYLNAKYKSEMLQAERERIEKQIGAERAEYRRVEQNLELGRRYRHDMRHHFSVIRELIRSGNAAEAEAYIQTLGVRLEETERKAYCRNPVANAVLSSLFGRAEDLGVLVHSEVDLPQRLPFDDADVCAVFSNLLENALNAASRAGEEKRISFTAECTARGKLAVSVENSVGEKVELGSDGLPVVRRSEAHGYGLSNVRYVVEKYNGVLLCVSREDVFSVKAVLFSADGGSRPHKPVRRIRLHSVAAVPVALSCLIMSLNFMPETLTALEGIPVFGSAVSAIDFRRWGFGWGDSEIRVEYPETGDDDADALTEKYLDECREKFFWYFERKYNGYTGADFTSEIERDDERMLVVSMYCTINAGSSLTYQRFFTVDKATGEIVGLSDLFSAEDYNAVLSAEIKRQIEYRTESGDSYYGYGIFTSPEDMENAFDSLDDPNFYIDGDDRLIIVFDEGEIAPNSMGTPTFVIPAVVTDPIASPEGLLAGGDGA